MEDRGLGNLKLTFLQHDVIALCDGGHGGRLERRVSGICRSSTVQSRHRRDMEYYLTRERAPESMPLKWSIYRDKMVYGHLQT